MKLKNINKTLNNNNNKERIDCIRFKPIEVDTDAVYNKIKERIEMSKIRIGVSPIWKYVSFAACISLLLLSFHLVKVAYSIKPLSYQEVTALAGSKTHILLPDSTEVWLNGDSWIRYPESFDGENREIELTGEAFFKVTKDVHHPFRVNLDGMSVQVLGTEFNVLAQKQSDIVETTLLEGAVALYKNSNETDHPDWILTPGEQAIYSKKNQQMEIRTVQPSFYTSWLTGDFRFEQVTFGQIVEVLERSFNVKFHIKDETLENICLTAQFTHHESLDKILSILQISMKYQYKIKEKDVFIE